MSAVWYIVREDERLDVEKHPPFDTFGEARSKAEVLRESFGVHFYVIKVQTAWTTKTLDELLKERGDRALAEFNKNNPIP